MSHAVVTKESFSELYNRFQNTAGSSDGPVVVMYYRENAVVHAYMLHQTICFKTTVEAEIASQFLQVFRNPIKLTSAY